MLGRPSINSRKSSTSLADISSTLCRSFPAHRLIVVTHVNNATRGHCTNYYRFLWHPWMQTAEDRDFRFVVREEHAPGELTAHQAALGFTPDDPPPMPKAPRNEEPRDFTESSDWPSPEEVRRTFNELRRSLGWPIKDENL